jgi:hypothetical protein
MSIGFVGLLESALLDDSSASLPNKLVMMLTAEFLSDSHETFVETVNKSSTYIRERPIIVKDIMNNNERVKT